MSRFYRFQNKSLKSKVSIIFLVTAGVLICLMVIVITAEKIMSYRETSRTNAMAIAQIVGANSTAALSFNDTITAGEILSALKAKKDILEAVIYDRDKFAFSRYINQESWPKIQETLFPERLDTEALRPDISFASSWYTALQPIPLNNKVAGYIVFRIDLSSLNRQLKYFFFIIISLGVILLTAGTVICQYLNKTVLKPVSTLAATMNNVSRTQNYKLRAGKKYDDEIGLLVDGFNNMLEDINHRDAELKLYRDELQNLVHRRTSELKETNRKLKEEILEREAIQDRLVHAQKMEAIGTLAGGVAHDLNNILSGVVTYPDLLLMQLPENSPLRKPIETIRASGQHAAAIVEDLLTLARRGVKREKQTDLQQIITSYLASLEFQELQGRHPDVQVIFPVQENTFPITGSPIHLFKTIMNLVANAMEAINGHGEIHINLERKLLEEQPQNFKQWRKGEYIVLTVRDNGSGIPAQYIDRIFEPFFSHKEMGKRSGTGLGMSVVWGTVEDHRGNITVTSIPNVETIFTLLFPATESGQEKPSVPEDTPEKPAASFKDRSVLIVDDSFQQRKIASELLTHLGYRAVTKASGETAVDFLKFAEVDLVILDMVMKPGISGLETFKRILEFKPDQRAIIASGFSTQQAIDEAQQLGITDFISKPYSAEKLQGIIDRIFADSDPPGENRVQ